jgi:hypothetical protein
MQLLVDVTTLCAGGAFELNKPARESTRVVVDGWEVEVRKGQAAVLVRGGSEVCYEHSYPAALARAQQGLDLMSIRGSNNLAVQAFDTDFLVWWPEARGLVIRICAIASLQIDVSPATLVLKDQDGNVIPPPTQAPLPWHESFRYFRLSQTSDDLFDSYRNAYLALESVLSSIAPQTINTAGRPKEGEAEWFRRALRAAARDVPLDPMVPQGTPDPVGYLFEKLYRDVRSAMSHSKSGRAVLLPRDESERSMVSERLQQLVHLYLKLAESHLGARRLGGGVIAAAFRRPYEQLFASMTAVASDDESPSDQSHEVANSSGGTVCELHPEGDPRSPESFAVTRLWSAPCADLSDLTFVRRVGWHTAELNSSAPLVR